MAKANIETAGGMKITVEGTADEVAAIIAQVKGKDHTPAARPQMIDGRKHAPKSSAPLADVILQLREEGFFNKPRKVIDVKLTLDQKAHFYPFPSVSTALIRWVRKGQLGRVKQDGAWCYVKR